MAAELGLLIGFLQADLVVNVTRAMNLGVVGVKDHNSDIGHLKWSHFETSPLDQEVDQESLTHTVPQEESNQYFQDYDVNSAVDDMDVGEMIPTLVMCENSVESSSSSPKKNNLKS